MKKIMAVLLTLVLVFSLAACNRPDSGDNKGSGDSDHSDNKGGIDTSKGIVYFCRNLGDKGFNDNGWWGTQDAAEKYGMVANCIELGADTSTYESAFLDACDSGKYSILVTQSNFGLADMCKKYGPEYPDMTFIAFDAGVTADFSSAPNVYGAAFGQNEGSWLAGVIAGTMTEKNHVGVYVYNDIPVGNDFLVGYLEGVRYANPDCEIEWVYGPGNANTAQVLELCNLLYDNGCDFIFCITGTDSISVAGMVTERGGIDAGLWMIGCDADQHAKALENTSTAPSADVIISSMIKDVRYTVTYCVDRAMEGTLPLGSVELLGLSKGGVDCLANDYFREAAPQKVQDAYDAAREAIDSGKVKVSSYFQFADYDEYAKYRDSFKG